MEQAADEVGRRLLALLEAEAASLLREGRASLHVTTIGEQYQVSHGNSAEVVYALRPTRPGALPVCLLPEVFGWSLLPGDGPAYEFWAGGDSDYAHTRVLVRAVMAGRYRYAYEQRLQPRLLMPWRQRPGSWVCTATFLLEEEQLTTEDWNVPPDPADALEVQASPY